MRPLAGAVSAEHGKAVALLDIEIDIGQSQHIKAVARVYEPTRGRLYAAGRVSALLTASVGLNPDATGRENIVLRGMYMDIYPREMRARITHHLY